MNSRNTPENKARSLQAALGGVSNRTPTAHQAPAKADPIQADVDQFANNLVNSLRKHVPAPAPKSEPGGQT